MSQLRKAAAAQHEPPNLVRLDAFMDFLQTKLAAPDYAEAESLLLAAIDPTHAARRQREANPPPQAA